MTRSARLTSGPVGPMMTRLTLQMLVGILAMVAFNLVDTYFIGQLGTAELAAISFTFPVVMMVGSLAAGLGVGASAVISRGHWRRRYRQGTSVDNRCPDAGIPGGGFVEQHRPC